MLKAIKVYVKYPKSVDIILEVGVNRRRSMVELVTGYRFLSACTLNQKASKSLL